MIRQTNMPHVVLALLAAAALLAGRIHAQDEGDAPDGAAATDPDGIIVEPAPGTPEEVSAVALEGLDMEVAAEAGAESPPEVDADAPPEVDADAPPADADMNAAAVREPLPPITRDPFWPVGFDSSPTKVPTPPAHKPGEKPKPPTPPVVLPEPGPADWQAARHQLKPTVGQSTAPDGTERHFAFLNNRLLTINQTVSVTTPLYAFYWRIGPITAAGVEFIPAEATRLKDGKRFAPPEAR